jgi:hypothetical protein
MDTCFGSTHRGCLFYSWFARPKFRNTSQLYSIEWKWKVCWWHGASGSGEWLCRDAKVDYRGNLPGMPRSAGAGLPGRLYRDLPLSTLLAHSSMYTFDMRGTVLKCIGAKFNPCNQQPTPVSAFSLIYKVPTTPRNIDPRHLYSLYIRERAW